MELGRDAFVRIEDVKSLIGLFQVKVSVQGTWERLIFDRVISENKFERKVRNIHFVGKF